MCLHGATQPAVAAASVRLGQHWIVTTPGHPRKEVTWWKRRAAIAVWIGGVWVRKAGTALLEAGGGKAGVNGN